MPTFPTPLGRPARPVTPATPAVPPASQPPAITPGTPAATPAIPAAPQGGWRPPGFGQMPGGGPPPGVGMGGGGGNGWGWGRVNHFGTMPLADLPGGMGDRLMSRWDTIGGGAPAPNTLGDWMTAARNYWQTQHPGGMGGLIGPQNRQRFADMLGRLRG